MIGESGYRQRYLKVQWWVILWRVLVLVQIPEVALVRPGRFTQPLSHGFLLMFLALAYTGVFYLLATRTRASGRPYLHVVDVCVCAAFLMMANDEKLIFVMAFFSFSSLLARPTARLREALPATVFLSVAFLMAGWTIGQEPWLVFSNPNELGSLALYYFWGIGFVGFSAVISRAAALELDSYLEEQRRDYRRRLHDDLGNTLCGLHFRIQSLAKGDPAGLDRVYIFLADGYRRAYGVLERLLTGLDEQVSGTLADSLGRLRDEIAAGGFELDLSLPSNRVKNGQVNLSPEVHREVYSIIREAVTNAALHSGANQAQVLVGKARGRLQIQVRDHGSGIDQKRLASRLRQGSLGMETMAERAQLIKGKLEVRDNPGGGTTVSLEMETRGGSDFIGRLLDYDPEQSSSGIYRYLVRLRAAMYVWTMIQLFLQPAGQTLSIPLVAVTLALTADCLAWVIWRGPLYRIFSWRPWLLVFEQLIFAGLVYVSVRAGLTYFFPLYMGVSIIMNALFLGSLGNLAVTAVLAAALLMVQTILPAWAIGAGTLGARYEPMLQHVTIFFILALTAGLAGEFVLGLQNLQLRAIDHALIRQRERLSAETHRQLHSLVSSLAAEIDSWRDGGDTYEQLDPKRLQGLEKSSSDLKSRLRAILNSLETMGPAEETAPPAPHQVPF